MYVIQFITILSWYGLVNICLCYRRIKTKNCRFSLLHSPNIFAAGLCLTTATWRCRKNFSQWELSFLWKLRCHWLKGLRQRQIPVVRQGPEHNIRDRCRASWIVKQYGSLWLVLPQITQTARVQDGDARGIIATNIEHVSQKLFKRFAFLLLCCDKSIIAFIPIFQVFVSDIRVLIQLSQCQWD